MTGNHSVIFIENKFLQFNILFNFSCHGGDNNSIKQLVDNTLLTEKK